MHHSIVARWQAATRNAICLVTAGLAGCAAPVDVDESVATSEHALGTCGSQTLPVVAATASGVENNHFIAGWAIDHNMATRWSSGQGAPEWLRLDLGQRSFISGLIIDWETAFSPDYEIQVSDNGVNFATVRRVVSATGGRHEITGLDVDARYVRIYARRVSGYGSVSIFEVSVIGATDPACSASPGPCGDSVRLPPVATAASSTEFSYTPASAGADDVYSTRWSSVWADDQWFALDLGATARIDRVRIAWEAAYARSYAIETGPSLSGPWSQAKLVTNGQGGVETVELGTTARFLRLRGITRATGYGISIWDLTVFGSKDLACSENLLTRGWDPNSVLDVACPGGAGCGTTYVLDPARPNDIDFLGGSFCPVSFHPTSLAFTQAVTSPIAASRFRFSLEVTNFSGFLGSGGCDAFGNTTFVVSLGDVEASSYAPEATFFPTPRGCVAGNGTLAAEIDVPFAAGETKNLSLGMTPIGFAAGPTCGFYASNFNVTNVELVAIE